MRISLPSFTKHADPNAEAARTLTRGMSFAYQVLDIVIAGILAGITAFGLAGIAPAVATDVGVLFAALYYFSRNPWGGNGDEVNAAIDDVYASLVPGK